MATYHGYDCEERIVKKRSGIDIIVPVYNALDDVKLCVESIKRHTDLSLDRLILIDDKSPDKNIFPYLESAEGNGIIVLQNEVNLGFPGTINRGLLFSDRDVIILNSDTIVTHRWVDKMVECAYSDPAIGMVTPFSNNATLCSIPNFCEENSVPHGLSIDEYAAVIEHCSMKAYPPISVAHGFCSLIKRTVIEKTGLFDKETFQRGYGEENDFCWRAGQLGYYPVLCDTAYVYHSGSESFPSLEKRKLMEDHQRILRERYPKQIHANDIYVRDNPHQYLRDNVSIYARLANGKKNLLYMVHLDFRTDSENNIGGTQFHVKDLVQHLKKDFNVFVLARDKSYLRLTAYTENDRISFKFYVGEKPAFQQFHNKKISDILENIIKAFSINLIHVHHVVGISFDIFDIAKRMGIPLLATLHDYYYICPMEKLLENGKKYCGGKGENCAGCLRHEYGYTEYISLLPLWREQCLEALSKCERLFTPSQAAKEIYAKIYPSIADTIHVMPHGMDRFVEEAYDTQFDASPELSVTFERLLEEGTNLSGWFTLDGVRDQESEIYIYVEDETGKNGTFSAMSVERQDIQATNANEACLREGFCTTIPDSCFDSEKLKIQLSVICNEHRYYGKTIIAKGYKKKEKQRKRIAFLGGLNTAKGSRLAYQIIKQSNDRYDWYIVGGIGDPDLLALKNVTRIGWYKRENVSMLLSLNQIDLVCILPIWPETFCYTVSEAEVAGIPILAAKIGALAERIEKDQTGWLIEHNAQAKDVLIKIESIFAQSVEWEAVKDRCMKFVHLSIADMCKAYTEIYDDLFISAERTSAYNQQDIYLAYVLCNSNSYAANSMQTAELINRLNELDATLNSINNSFGFKLLQYFRKANFPGKRLIKAAARFAFRVYKKLK